MTTEEAYLRRRAAQFDRKPESIARFRRLVFSFWRRYGRTLPWRLSTDPYTVLVSEVMLQQTQAERVAQKYEVFLAAFPDFETLASARLQAVLRVWKGLGYNRRAARLKQIAERVVAEYRGVLPSAEHDLIKLPGIGRATACAICAYAFNKPVVYIETNIRTVFLHFFFRDQGSVTDGQILPLVEKTLDRRRPRQWYSALMDLGVAVKKTFGNAGQRSAHYSRQTPFEGSRRQARGKVLRTLVETSPLGPAAIARRTGLDPVLLQELLPELEHEGFVIRIGRRYAIP